VSGDKLPANVKGFIESHVTSVEQLEIFLWLIKSFPQELTALQVYEKILSSRDSVQGWLEQLASQQLLSRITISTPVTYAYLQRDPETHATMLELAEAYEAYPVRVIELIYTRDRSVRQNPMQGFADAFRIRKDKAKD